MDKLTFSAFSLESLFSTGKFLCTLQTHLTCPVFQEAFLDSSKLSYPLTPLCFCIPLFIPFLAFNMLLFVHFFFFIIYTQWNAYILTILFSQFRQMHQATNISITLDSFFILLLCRPLQSNDQWFQSPEVIICLFQTFI